MKTNKNLYLLILNIIHSTLILGLYTFLVSYYMTGEGNIPLFLIIFVITILSVIGMWLLYILPSAKAALIILRIKSILKVIFTISFIVVLLFLLLIVQECSHSFGSNKGEVQLEDKLSIIIPFLVMIGFSIFYFVIYQIILVYIKKQKVNKPIYIMTFICNVILFIFIGLYLCFSLIEVQIGFITFSDDFLSIDNNLTKLIFIGVILLYLVYKSYLSFLLMKLVCRKKINI